jgi:hypothetical protein
MSKKQNMNKEYLYEDNEGTFLTYFVAATIIVSFLYVFIN